MNVFTDEELEEEEKEPLKVRLLNIAIKALDFFCIWDCCWCWIRLQELFALIVFDPFMELFITLCIVVNTLFMAMDHHNMNDDFAHFLDVGNTFFTTTFAIEAFLKLIALSPKFYFREGWNIFDFLIVTLSLMEKAFEGVGGFSVLRTFRLLRVFKLAKSWPTLNLLITIMGKAMGSLGNLTFVLGIIIFIFAVMGNQLFSKSYEPQNFESGVLPRWHFKDFLHSFMIVFRVLCGEWIESMWDCMHVCGAICVPFFLCVVIIGNLVVLSLFLALLLSSFGASNLSAPTSESADTKKLQEAFERFSRAQRWIKNRILSIFKPRNRISDQTLKNGLSIKDVNEGRMTKLTAGEEETENTGESEEMTHQARKSKLQNSALTVLNSIKVANAMKPQENAIAHESTALTIEHNKEQEEEKNFDADAVDANENEMAVENVDLSEYPADCFGESFYQRFPCCLEETPFWDRWKRIRFSCYQLVENKYFETLVITLILFSSGTLVSLLSISVDIRLTLTPFQALEDVYLKDRQWLIDMLYYVDKFFTIIFFFEMVLKWFAYGFKYYFSNAWCWLDFIIVMVSVLNFGAELMNMSKVQAFKTMRTLRALRPLRAMSRMQGMKVVVNALVQAIPAIFNVLLVCLIFWLIFAIMGVQFFSGKFAYCRNRQTKEAYNASEVPNMQVCTNNSEAEWHNPSINFDNVPNAYLALFQVATWKGWLPVMDHAVDSRHKSGLQPIFEINKYMYIYFVFFIILGSFFTLNLFIGVIIDNFNEQKKKTGGSMELFMSEDQKKYYNAMKKMGKRKPIKAIPRPRV
ncbi:uncharacterized protein B4U80_02113 [Leptotrombidium deliense]|uniref:Sodium channel protein para-like protein n=1 Tax=Leptotrombidium deliense TaxID=299467 RepID=A0A443SK43_9ACAR|nr:uncharacterized protein B4U80_02113 [Leptotrombidium deliense]